MIADMLHNAMPVIERVSNPDNNGMMTPGDNRELVTRALAPVLSELAELPQISAMFETLGEGLVRYADDVARQDGRLMTDAQTMPPEAAPAPDAGKDGTP